MYFYKKGKGRYRKAPPESLQAALASVERKQREAAQIAGWVADLGAHRLPAEFAPKLSMLLYKPDKNALEWKALAAACDAAKTNPLDLLAACGAIPSTHDYHFNRFLAEAFPRGVAFPDWGALPHVPDLPRADVRAFSIDDATTTEIDDAFSVRELTNGNIEIGIHIACPALAIPRGSALDAIARERLSTVYMPGRKLTMLPEAAVAAFTLRQGTSAPALSLYIETDAGRRAAVARNAAWIACRSPPTCAFPRCPTRSPTRCRRRPIRRGRTNCARCGRLAQHLSARRGKTDVNRIDYSFDVDWDADARGPRGHRRRASAAARSTSWSPS